MRSLRSMPSTSSLIAVGWSPFGSYSDLITKRTPPSDFSGRGGRCGVQILTWPSSPLNSGRPSRIRFSSASAVALTPSASILLRGGRASASSSSSAVGRPSCRASSGSSVGIVADGAVIGLRRFVKTLARRIALGDVFAGSLGRGPRAMRGRLAAGAAVPGIVRRRLQAGARAHAGIAAVDRGIEQFGQRRPDRLHVGPCALELGALDFGVLPGFLGVSGFFAIRRIWDESG